MSLYNEFRPHSLNDIKGQDNVVAQIRGILATGNIPNVSLFVGPRGTGKTSIARIFAKSINCNESRPESGSCNQCKSCAEIDAGVSLDVIELDAASHNKVDDVHGIIEGSSYTPIGKYKVYIIDEVHMLSTSAFNALLKLLEEPPTYCKFILCTTEKQKIPATILSRCRKFDFQRIDLSVISDKLVYICENKGITNIDLDAIHMIAKKSDGCMRDAESILECFIDSKNVTKEAVAEVLGIADEESIYSILSGLFNGSFDICITAIRTYQKRGKNLHLLIHSLMEAISDITYLLQAGNAQEIDGTIGYIDCISRLSSKTTVADCIKYMNGLSDIFTLSQKGAATDFLIETKLLSMMCIESTSNLMDVKINRLSNQLEALEHAFFEGVSSNSSYNAEASESLVDSSCSEGGKILLNESQSTVEVSTAIKEGPESFESGMPDDIPFPDKVAIYEDTKMEEETPSLSSIPISESAIETPSVPHFAVNGILPGDVNLPAGVKVLGSIDLSSVTNHSIPMASSTQESSIVSNKEDTDFNPPVSENIDEKVITEQAVTRETEKSEANSVISSEFVEIVNDIPIFSSFFNT